MPLKNFCHMKNANLLGSFGDYPMMGGFIIRPSSSRGNIWEELAEKIEKGEVATQDVMALRVFAFNLDLAKSTTNANSGFVRKVDARLREAINSALPKVAQSALDSFFNFSSDQFWRFISYYYSDLAVECGEFRVGSPHFTAQSQFSDVSALWCCPEFYSAKTIPATPLIHISPLAEGGGVSIEGAKYVTLYPERDYATEVRLHFHDGDALDFLKSDIECFSIFYRAILEGVVKYSQKKTPHELWRDNFFNKDFFGTLCEYVVKLKFASASPQDIPDFYEHFVASSENGEGDVFVLYKLVNFEIDFVRCLYDILKKYGFDVAEK